MSEHLTIATANTHMGRMVQTKGGLEPVWHADLLAMQEVHPDRDDLEERLAEDTDLRPVAVAPEYGLAIAAHPKLLTRATYKHTLQERGVVGRMLVDVETRHTTAFRTRARGILGITVQTPGGQYLDFEDTHPIIPLKWRARNRQVRTIPERLNHVAGTLVVAGDMNHYPGPRLADLAMREALDLRAVDIGDEPTYVVARSGRPWLRKVLRKTMQMDAILYRGLKEINTEVVDIESDHRAVITTFSLN